VVKVFGYEVQWSKPATSVALAIINVWLAALFALTGIGPLCLASVITAVILLTVAQALRERRVRY
jgi:hypothetical protein